MAGKIIIDPELCKGCDYCITACPHKLIEKTEILNENGYFPVKFKDNVSCPGKGCNICYLVCPEVAIIILKNGEEEQK